MHPKDIAILALALSLSAMGFLIANLLKGQLYDATFAGAVMVLAGGYVVWFIAGAVVPKARG